MCRSRTASARRLRTTSSSSESGPVYAMNRDDAVPAAAPAPAEAPPPPPPPPPPPYRRDAWQNHGNNFQVSHYEVSEPCATTTQPPSRWDRNAKSQRQMVVCSHFSRQLLIPLLQSCCATLGLVHRLFHPSRHNVGPCSIVSCPACVPASPSGLQCFGVVFLCGLPCPPLRRTQLMERRVGCSGFASRTLCCVRWTLHSSVRFQGLVFAACQVGPRCSRPPAPNPLLPLALACTHDPVAVVRLWLA